MPYDATSDTVGLSTSSAARSLPDAGMWAWVNQSSPAPCIHLATHPRRSSSFMMIIVAFRCERPNIGFSAPRPRRHLARSAWSLLVAEGKKLVWVHSLGTARKEAASGLRKRPLTWVGLTGFEPATT